MEKATGLRRYSEAFEQIYDNPCKSLGSSPIPRCSSLRPAELHELAGSCGFGRRHSSLGGFALGPTCEHHARPYQTTLVGFPGAKEQNDYGFVVACRFVRMAEVLDSIYYDM